jgi:hypothetical protein
MCAEQIAVLGRDKESVFLEKIVTDRQSRTGAGSFVTEIFRFLCGHLK